MQIQEAVETCVTKKYADFEGYATRSEFWWFVLFIWVVETLVGIAYRPLAGLFWLAMLVPYFAVGTRRLRDTDRSPWCWALALVPVVGWIVLIVFFAQPGRTPATPATPA
jgi:uncharacterized membrane protein YhaH (DUF805 family)